MGYADLHEHLRMLEEAGHLRRINQTINKDTELHPAGALAVPRRHSRPRTARLGTSPTSRTPAGAASSSRWWWAPWPAARPSTFSAWAATAPKRWTRSGSTLSPIPSPPCWWTTRCARKRASPAKPWRRKAWTRFRSPSRRRAGTTAPTPPVPHWITKDPETGIANIGNYRGQIKSPTRVGVFPSGTRPGHLSSLEERPETR